MLPRRVRVILCVAAAALLLSAVIVVAAGGAHSPPRHNRHGGALVLAVNGSAPVEVAADAAMEFAPADLEVASGGDATLVLLDLAGVPVDWALCSSEGVVLPRNLTPSSLTATCAASVVVSANATETVSASFAAPSAAGWWEFVSLVSGEFQEGMYGFLSVAGPLPSNLTVTPAPVSTGQSGGAPIGWLLAFVLLLVVLFLAARALVRRRRRKGKPPVRSSDASPPRSGGDPHHT